MKSFKKALLKTIRWNKSKTWLFGALAGSFMLREAYINSHLKSFKDEIVLITGGSQGIGLLIAEKFAREGSIVVIWARDMKKMEKAKSEIERKVPGSRIHLYKVDVADQASVIDTAALVKKQVGIVSVLIHNAGIVSGKEIGDLTDKDYDRIQKVNATSHFWATKAFLPDMIAQDKGHIISITSAAGMIGVGRMTDYNASKFAAFGFNEALRAELRSKGHASAAKRGKGVQVMCVCPYFIDTGMFENVQNNNVPFLLPILKPEYVAEQVVRGAKRSDQLLVMPYFGWAIFLVRPLLSGRIFDKMMYDWVGIQKTMVHFDAEKTGRHMHSSNASQSSQPSHSSQKSNKVTFLPSSPSSSSSTSDTNKATFESVSTKPVKRRPTFLPNDPKVLSRL